MGFSRKDYWSGLASPPPGYLPHPGIKPMSLMFPPLVNGFFTTSATWDLFFTAVSNSETTLGVDRVH